MSLVASLKALGFGLWQQPLILGAWFGLLHAFDADHLTTLSGLAVADRSVSATGYALRWSAGHAAALGLIGGVALGLGLWGFTALSAYAELAVAVLLIGVGLQALALLAGRGGNRLPTPTRERHSHGRGAGVVMGVLHGGAGSAAVLALLPLAGYGAGVESLLYLAAFSVGVAAGALAFSAVLGRVLARAGSVGGRLGSVILGCVGLSAVATGGLLLLGLADGG